MFNYLVAWEPTHDGLDDGQGPALLKSRTLGRGNVGQQHASGAVDTRMVWVVAQASEQNVEATTRHNHHFVFGVQRQIHQRPARVFIDVGVCRMVAQRGKQHLDPTTLSKKTAKLYEHNHVSKKFKSSDENVGVLLMDLNRAK